MRNGCVKFIVVAGQIIFGTATLAYHADIARANRVSESSVSGGGIADLNAKRIFGTSYGFGPYDPELVKAVLPDWQVEAPSDY